MLKHVALLKVDMPEKWYSWHSGPTANYYKSDFSVNKKDVEDWLATELAKYTDKPINGFTPDRKYLIYFTIISFDVEESQNVETFLNEFIH